MKIQNDCDLNTNIDNLYLSLQLLGSKLVLRRNFKQKAD